MVALGQENSSGSLTVQDRRDGKKEGCESACVTRMEVQVKGPRQRSSHLRKVCTELSCGKHPAESAQVWNMWVVS